jgi:hypothetical protein
MSRSTPRRARAKRVRRLPILKVEQLESRQLLTGTVFITEFVADNTTTLLDQDGAASDWVELHNPTSSTVNLDGYYLTDNHTNLTKWRIPAVSLPANGYMVIFASSKNRSVPGQELHTNFSLAKDGEYLGLVAPNGSTILSDFDPQFPSQNTNVSYGSPVVSTTLVNTGAATKIKVPSAAIPGWETTSFNDSSWTSGTTGVGFGSGYTGLLGTNIQSSMLNINSSAYLRIPFNVADPTAFDALTLRMRYNDGFVAYLNGVEVARKNAPTTPQFNSAATATGPSGTGTPEDFDVSLNLSNLVAGNNVLAIQGLNAAANSADFIISPQLLGLKTDGNAPGYLASPTPNAVNVAGSTPAVADTKFDHNRGIYNAPFDAAITTTTPGATIRYTLNGSPPSTTTGTIYTGPIHITTTSVLRAMAYKTGSVSTDVDTQTYVFPNDVIHQPVGAGGFPNNTYDVGNNHTAARNSAMNQTVVTNPAYATAVLTGLSSIPTLSLVSDASNFFGANGIMDGADNRPVSVEYIDPAHPNDNTQADGAGGLHSHERLKQSIGLTFNSTFGESKFKADILQNGPLNGDSAVDQFDHLVLRAGNNRSWARDWNPDATTYTEDEWYRASLIDIQNGIGSHGNFVQLYLNGVYWGLYNTAEKPDDSWDESYYGGVKENWFAVSHDGPDSGDATRYNYLIGALSAKNMSVAANYNEMLQYLDPVNFSDYLLLSWYIGLTDWPANNWWGGNRNNPISTMHFTTWDGEWSWDRARYGEPVAGAYINPSFDPGSNDPSPAPKIWKSVSASPDFMMTFADRLYRAVANSGPLSDQQSIARWDTLNNYIRDAVVDESARWGDSLAGLGQPTRTRDVDWQNEVDKIRGLMVGNGAKLIAALRNFNYYPSIDPATLSQQGGLIHAGFPLTMSNPNGGGGSIYYTTDGSDPRLAGGGISGAAILYTGAVTLNADTTIKVRVKNGATWSAINVAVFAITTQNTAPIVNAGNPQTINLPASANLAGTASDDGLPSGSTLTTTWSKFSGPGIVTFGNANLLSTTAGFSTTGTYVLRLTGTDGTLTSTSDVTITVNNTASGPQIASVLLINTDTQATVATLTAGTTNNMNLATLPAHITFQATTNPTTVGSVKFGYDAASNFRTENGAPYFFNGDYIPYSFTTGSHTLMVTAYTGSGASGTAGTTLSYPLNTTNGGTNQAPVPVAGSNQTIVLPNAASLSGTVSDDGLPTGASVTTTWSKFSGPGTVTFGNANLLATTATFSTAGTYVLRLSANDTALTGTSDVTITVQPVPPNITGVGSSTANGSYTTGQAINVAVTFSGNVTVTGSPRIALNSGGGAFANYASGSGTSVLNFTYTVASGDSSADLDCSSIGALTLNGGTIKDASPNNATLTLPAPGAAGSLGANKSIVIDTAAPTVSNVTATTADGTYGVGQNIAITVTFSEAVTVTGTPRIAVNIPGGAFANYTSGSGTNTLTFTYTVAAGHNIADLDYVTTSSLALNGGTIKDAALNNATLTLPATGGAGSLGFNKNIVIDTTGPTVSSVSSTTANGTYGVGGSVTITVTFNEIVNVTGTPTLALNSGGSASYSSGSGTNTLSFTYTVAAGQNSSDLDYSATSSLALAGGTIRDGVLNNAPLTLPAPGAAGSLGANKTIVIDTTPPTAVFNGEVPIRDAATMDFTITYADANGVDTTSFDNGDITVTGPGGYNQSASFTGNVAGVATYRIPAPGGTWNLADNGNYTITQNTPQVKDLAGNFRFSGTIGTIGVNFAFAWMGASQDLRIEFDGTSVPITLATSGANITATRNGQTLPFAGVNTIVALGTGNDDALEVNGPLTPALQFSSGNGHDSLAILSGNYIVPANLDSDGIWNIDLSVAAGASASFAGSEHFNSLTLNGNASISPGGGKVLVVGGLTIDANARLDLADNGLVVDYDTVSPIGSWSGSAYDGITGLIASGRNGGDWSGKGIVTTAGVGNFRTLAVSRAFDVFGASGGVFGNETVDSTSILLKFTYGGDATLDGKINIDDYVKIDSGIAGGYTGWVNGDFNYDGKVSIDDYITVIDANIGNQS